MDKLFEKYRKRLAQIGIFKSIMLSIAIALISMGVVAIITWLAMASVPVALGLTFGLGVGIFFASVFPLYYKCFRPTDKMVAQQLDALGLDERYITMYECSENSSQMAQLQRQDAKNRLSNVSTKSLKYSLALPIVLLLVFGLIFAVGSTTASMLVKANGSNSNNEIVIVPPPEEKTQYFTVTYKVYESGTGSIRGNLTQKVEKGKYTEKVTAIPSSGYKFVAWVDEEMNHLANQNNPRYEVNVQSDMTIFALFEKEEEPDDDVDGEIEGETGKKDPNEEGSEGEIQGGEGGEGSSGGEQEGTPREDNSVIDGTKDYKENFDREQYEKELPNKDLPDDLKDILGDYYGTLKP